MALKWTGWASGGMRAVVLAASLTLALPMSHAAASCPPPALPRVPPGPGQAGAVYADIGADRQDGGDATAAIAAAFARAAANLAVAVLPCGSYGVSGLDIPAGLTVMPRQAGCVTLRRLPGGAAGPLLHANAGGWSIGALVLDGNKDAAPGAGDNLLIEGARCFAIEGLRSVNAGVNGIAIGGSDDAGVADGRIAGVTLADNGQNGLQLDGAASGLSVSGSSATGNGGNGFDFGNIRYPYEQRYKGSISGLVLDGLTATGNGSSGVALHGFTRIGTASQQRRAGGPGGDAILGARITNIEASNNAHYGVVTQVDGSTVAHIHTSGDGANRPHFFAGLLANAENTTISDVTAEEAGLAFGIDAGGCTHCTLQDIHTVGPVAGVDLEATRFTSIENTTCDLTPDRPNATCIELQRAGGNGQAAGTGASAGWDWDAHDDTVENTTCNLTGPRQSCIRVLQDPHDIDVRNSTVTGTPSTRAFIFQCTQGCNFVGDPAQLATARRQFATEYAGAAYSIVITAGGANYGQPEAQALGDCAEPPKAKLTIRPDTGAVANGRVVSKGAGCTGTPQCQIVDQAGQGEGATCRWGVGGGQ